MNLLKKIDEIDITELLADYHRLESDIVWTDMGKGKQAGLQYQVSKDPDLWQQDRVAKDENGVPYTKETWNSAVGRMKDRELSFDQINPYIVGTSFERVITKYKLSRTRLMWINGMRCYSIHKDSTPRIHIPLITNKECYFVFKQGLAGHIEYMPTGYVYWTDTRQDHTFMNCSEEPRLHIVGAVSE
jgi:hypothetical protein